MNDIVITGNFSDSPSAIDLGQFFGMPLDISDLVSLKTFANSEFCPRFIPFDPSLEVGRGLTGKTVVICSGSSQFHTRNELAMRNLILARAARENGADRVILIEPDLFYSAQDRGPYRFGSLENERPRNDLRKFDGEPFTGRLYGELLQTAGVDEVVTVHNHSDNVQQLFKKIFHGHFYNLLPSEVYAHYIRLSDFAPPGEEGRDLVLCAPDNGARAFVEQVWNALALPRCGKAIMHKVREGERRVNISVAPDSPTGLDDLAGKNVVILDDMVRTGSTIVECCRLIRKTKPARICFVVTHFRPSPEARENLNAPELDEILTTNTLPAILNRDCQGRLRKKMAVVKLGKWIARFLLQRLDKKSAAAEGELYAVDMSSKNPRWVQA